jgi:2,3-bisphosphoglycerate-dependent phosphoglycerate mutase
MSDEATLNYFRANKVAQLMDGLVGDLLKSKPAEPYAFLEKRLEKVKECQPPYTLVLVRHGESQWNVENKFTGWVDVELSEKGEKEADAGGKALKEAGYSFDVAYTSVLKRAIHTCWRVLTGLDQCYIPTHRDWRLNERFYGGLTGLDKKETVQKHGPDQVQIWRRSFDVPPPPLEKSNQYHPTKDPKYKNIPAKDLPDTECLKDTIVRCLPLWEGEIAPALRSGKKVLIAAHGNTIRAICKHLDNIPEDLITGLEIPTGIPMAYKLDANLKPIADPEAVAPLNARFIGDPAVVKAAQDKVKNQTKA